MKNFSKIFCAVLLCLFGVMGVQAKTEKVYATFENPSNTNTTWTPDASGETAGTFTWSTTYYNQLRNIGLPTGDITKYKKLVVNTEIKSGEQFRILIYKGGSNLTLYASNGVNEFILADTLKALYPDNYNEFLLACDEVCLSGNNAAAPGEAVIKEVYMETYNDEGEKVYATFESPNNTNTTWTPDASGETAGTFTWSTTYYNQLRNIGLPTGDISKYKKLVVDTEIKSGEQFRILIYKGGSNLTLYAQNGVNEFILADTLKALYPDTYNEFLLACDEICLSGNNAAAPGEAVINEVYLETYPENESVDIPEIVYEEDPGKPAGDFVDFTTAFPSLQPRIGLGTDGHPIVLGNGDVVVGARSKAVIADLSGFSKLTMVTSPNLKLVLYMNHEIDAKQTEGEYAETDAGKYVFLNVQADENGLIEVDLTQFDKQDLNCICLPWDNSNKGTVWYILLTEKPHEYAIVGDFTGGWPSDENPKPDMLMTQSEENPDVYTLVIEHFEAEAKTYEYKLRDHYSWDNTYQLPASGNNNYVFTNPGTYTLTFTANVAEHVLTLNVEKEEITDIQTMSIAGDLTGGWPSKNEETGEWDWSVAKPMVQDSEDPDLWTLTIQGVNVEAKKYEYKAFANSSYFGYQLPAEGNADFVFGTKNYPAGTYTLIFTANVGEHKHWLKLEAVNENPEATDINFDVAGGDIAQALEQAKTGVSKVGNITINLTKGVEYTISNTLEAPASITINGNDAIIDASELTAPMVSMANVEEPTEWTEANVRIAGLKIKGLKQALFFSTCKNYLIKDFTVDWVNVEVAADATVFDFTKGSVALNFNVTNSTFYAPTATTKSFYSSQSGQKATEADGEAIQTFKFANNTMYNLAKSKNFFSHRQSNQSWLAYDVQGNIFVNCGKSGQTIKGMNGGQGGKNPTWTIKGNAFNFEGTDTSASESTGDDDEAVEESVAGVVTFVNADEGNFNGEFALSEGVAPQTLGAPMWTITFKAAPAPYYLSGNFNDWGVDDLYKLELNTKADEGVEEYMITVQLAADAQFKVVKAEDPKGAAEDWVWYPAGTGNAYGENGELAAAGTYIVYFRPNRDGGDDWFHGYIYVFNPATDGINTIAAEAQKGNVYNMQGIRVAQPTKGLYIINGHKVVIK